MFESKKDRFGLKKYVLNIDTADTFLELKKALTKDLNMICETIDRNKKNSYYPNIPGGMLGSD